MVIVFYLYCDYSVFFDCGIIFDLNIGYVVNVDCKICFDEVFNIIDGYFDFVQFNVEYCFNDVWIVCFDYSYSQDYYNDNQVWVMVYDLVIGNFICWVDGIYGLMQKMYFICVDLQGNVVVGGFYNELLIGVVYENYDLLCIDMLCCKNVKGFNIYYLVYGIFDICNIVFVFDSDQWILQESYVVYVQDVLYLIDNWIVVVGVCYQYYIQYVGKG